MVWEQGVSIIAMVTAEEVLWFHHRSSALPSFSRTTVTDLSLMSSRNVAERRATGIGPDLDHGTTR